MALGTVIKSPGTCLPRSGDAVDHTLRQQPEKGTHGMKSSASAYFVVYLVLGLIATLSMDLSQTIHNLVIRLISAPILRLPVTASKAGIS